jgi:chemotaxis protein methyltransferase CheR
VLLRAVDVNPRALDKAQRGRYSAWALRELPPEFVARWFRLEHNEYVLDSELRKEVEFQEKNLHLDDPELWARETYDVVFCRNALMYFTPAQAERLVARITRALVPGGYLFLGHAETLRGLSHDFHLKHTHETFYYQRKGSGTSVAPSLPFLPSAPSVQPYPDGAPHWTTTWLETVQQTSARIEQLTRAPLASTTVQDAPPAEDAARPEEPLYEVLELVAHERFRAALERLEELAPVLPRDGEVLLVRAALLLHAGQADAAQAVCAELLALDELNAGAHYLLALCRERAGEPDDAREHAQVAAHLDPTFALPRLHLGIIERRKGRRESARRELGQALLLLPREQRERLILFTGGLGRESLLAMCRSELLAAGGTP